MKYKLEERNIGCSEVINIQELKIIRRYLRYIILIK
jgi:hypothetical protein